MVCSLRALADKPYYDTLAGAGYVTAARGWETIRYAWGATHTLANYWRCPGRGQTMQALAYADACPGPPQRA